MSHDPHADKIHRGKASSTSQNSHNQNFKSMQNKPSPQCARVQARLLAYLDGSVSERERASLQQHLDSCARCRQELAAYQMSEQTLSGALSAVPPAGDLRPAFYARLASETVPKSSRFPGMNWRLAVPALTACSLLAGWLSMPHQRQIPQAAVGLSQKNRAARGDQNNSVQNSSVAVIPMDATQENQAVSPASPALSNERIARNPVVLPPARIETEALVRLSRVHPINPKANQKANTRRKPTVLLIAGIERHREIGSHEAFANAAQRELSALADSPVERSRQKDTTFFTYGEQSKTRLFQPVAPPPSYSLSGALTLRGDMLFKKQSENLPSLSTTAPGQPSGTLSLDASTNHAEVDRFASLGNNTADSLAVGMKNNFEHNRFEDNKSEENRIEDNKIEDNGIAIQVRDSRRGFTSSLRLASRVQQRDGKQVLTLRIEDMDENASSTDAYTPLPGEVRMGPK